MKKTDYSFKLVDTTYSPMEAREVLISLITDKIYSLNQKIFRIYEKYSGDTAHIERRVMELNELEVEYSKLLKSLANENVEVVVDCEVKLKVRAKSEHNVEKAAQEVQ